MTSVKTELTIIPNDYGPRSLPRYGYASKHLLKAVRLIWKTYPDYACPDILSCIKANAWNFEGLASQFGVSRLEIKTICLKQGCMDEPLLVHSRKRIDFDEEIMANSHFRRVAMKPSMYVRSTVDCMILQYLVGHLGALNLLKWDGSSASFEIEDPSSYGGVIINWKMNGVEYSIYIEGTKDNNTMRRRRKRASGGTKAKPKVFKGNTKGSVVSAMRSAAESMGSSLNNDIGLGEDWWP